VESGKGKWKVEEERGKKEALSGNFDRAVDLVDKEVARVKADGTREDKEDGAHDKGVAKVEEGRNKGSDVKFGEKVENAVKEDVKSGGSGREEGTPPPVVVLGAELKVAHDDGDLGAGDDEDQEDEEEETKHVVELMLPDGGEDEEEFDEDGAKRKNSSHQDRDHWLHVPDEFWRLSRDLIHLDGDFRSLFVHPTIIL